MTSLVLEGMGTMVKIKIPHSVFLKIMFELVKTPGLTAVCEASCSRMLKMGLFQILFHRLVGYKKYPDASGVEEGFIPVFISFFRDVKDFRKSGFMEQVKKIKLGLGLCFFILEDSIHGYFYLKKIKGIEGPFILSLPGPGMEKLMLSPMSEITADKKLAANENLKKNKDNLNHGENNSYLFYDRFASLLGYGNIEAGFKLMEKARKLMIMIIGLGRIGSWLAYRFAQAGIGVEGGLIFVDYDVVNVSNLVDMFVFQKFLGMNKAEGVAMTIEDMIPNVKIIVMNASIRRKEVVDICKTSDAVITTVDDDACRFGAAVLAARYHLLHLDISGGSAWTEERKIITGGELRGYLPAPEARCLGCMGHYDLSYVQRILTQTDIEENSYRNSIDWYRQKPGSSTDLNLPLIGECNQFFWYIMKGEVKESFWYHYEKDASGKPIWTEYSGNRKQEKCIIHDEQFGLGDMSI